MRADLRHDDQFLSGSGLLQIRLLHQVTNIFLGEGSGVGDRGSGDGSCYRVDGLEFEAQVRKGRRCFESSSASSNKVGPTASGPLRSKAQAARLNGPGAEGALNAATCGSNALCTPACGSWYVPPSTCASL